MTLHPKDTTTASNTLSRIPEGSLFIASVYISWRSEKERKQNPKQGLEQLYSGQLVRRGGEGGGGLGGMVSLLGNGRELKEDVLVDRLPVSYRRDGWGWMAPVGGV